MDVLRQRPTGREVMVAGDMRRIVEGRPQRDELLERRRRAFTGLLSATGGTLLLAVIVGGGLWLLFGLSAGLLISYVSLLLRLKQQRDHARWVVRELREREPIDLAELEAEEAYERHG